MGVPGEMGRNTFVSDPDRVRASQGDGHRSAESDARGDLLRRRAALAVPPMPADVPNSPAEWAWFCYRTRGLGSLPDPAGRK